MTSEQFDRVIAVDLRGVFLCGREAALHMVEGRRRHRQHHQHLPHRQTDLRRPESRRLGHDGHLGEGARAPPHPRRRHRARLLRDAAGRRDEPEGPRKVVATVPLRRLGQPDEIARAALFILQNDYFDGRVIEIDGGLRL
jgi:3-oxoacyl-[acyl-carrier protein] reductase